MKRMIFILTFLMVVAMSGFTYAEETCLDTGNLYRVSGISMEPTLNDGDVVKLIPGPVSDGDIVIADVGAYGGTPKLVIKRVVGDWLIGDNRNVTAVYRLCDVKVLGKVIKVKVFNLSDILYMVEAETYRYSVYDGSMQRNGTTTNPSSIPSGAGWATVLVSGATYRYSVYDGFMQQTGTTANSASIPKGNGWAVPIITGATYQYSVYNGFVRLNGTTTDVYNIPSGSGGLGIGDWQGWAVVIVPGSSYRYSVYDGFIQQTGTTTNSNSIPKGGGWATSIKAPALDTTPPPAPTANPAGGTYNTSKSVTLSDTESGVTIRYTTNGTDPTTSSTVYSSAINISSTTTLKARAWDAAGNASTVMTQTYTIIIDTTPPTQPTFSANPITPTNGTVYVTINYSADSTVKQYKIGASGTYQNYSTAIPVTTNNTTIYARAQDAAGNWSTENNYTVTNIDKTAPTITLTQSPTTTTNGSVTVTVTAADANGIALKKWASGNQSTAYFNAQGTVLSGTTFTVGTNNTYTVYARDNAGNGAVQTIPILNIDTIPPTQPTFSANPSTPTNSAVYVTINYSADSTIRQYRTGASYQNYTSAIPVTTNNTTIYARAQDASGNWCTESSYTVTNIDNTPPTGTITANDGKQYVNKNPVKLTLTTSDAVQVYISIDSTPPSIPAWQPYASTINWNYTGADGLITIYAWFRDAAGNVSTAAWDDIVYDATPTTGTITIDNGASSTFVSLVTLKFTNDYNDPTNRCAKVNTMEVSNFPDFSNSTTMPYTDYIDVWELDTTASGVKTVYVRYTDWAGNISSPFSASIEYTPIERVKKFITCDEYGNTDATDVNFTQATITVKDTDLDTSGNYVYYGVDVGIFKKPDPSQPASGQTNWPAVVPTKRIETDSLQIQITDLGDMDNYDFEEVYVLGFRVLYKQFDSEDFTIFESAWKQPDDSYFKLDTGVAEEDVFISCDEYGRIRPTDKEFETAAVNVTGVDETGNYVYYGVDIGIFKKPNVQQPAAGQTDWPKIFMKRLNTSNKTINIDNFGSKIKYDYNEVYTIGYRILYYPLESEPSTIMESPWRRVQDSYFEIIPKSRFIDSILHTQIIRYNHAGGWKTIEVQGPDESGLTGSELSAYERFNTFIDGDIVTYKVNFEVSRTSRIGDSVVDLAFNTLSEPGVELVLTGADLYKAGVGKIQEINISGTKTGTNRYSIPLGTEANTGRPILEANGDGEYYLLYKGRLVNNSYSSGYSTITNTASITITDKGGKAVASETGANFKDTVRTKLFKGGVIYR